MRYSLDEAGRPSVYLRRGRGAVGQRPRELDWAHVGGTEGKSVEQFREEHHGGNIAVIRSHAMHSDEDEDGVRKGLVKIADR